MQDPDPDQLRLPRALPSQRRYQEARHRGALATRTLNTTGIASLDLYVIFIMVFIFDGSCEHFFLGGGVNLCDFCRCNQTPYVDHFIPDTTHVRSFPKKRYSVKYLAFKI